MTGPTLLQLACFVVVGLYAVVLLSAVLLEARRRRLEELLSQDILSRDQLARMSRSDLDSWSERHRPKREPFQGLVYSDDDESTPTITDRGVSRWQ